MKQNRLFKTLFVLLLVVLGYTNMQAQNGNIQFADSHVKEICVQNWDTNGDGELSYDEAAAVTSLSNALFQGNEDITSFDELQYFTGITEIPYSSFMQCVNLTSVILPPNVHDIETMAFFGCTSLTSVYLHDQVVNVGANAWSGCSSVSSVYIGANVATFNVNPFGEMTNLEAFDVSPDNVTFASIDGLLMSADGTSLIQYPAGKHDVEFVIGSSITQVGSDAFRGCAYLKKLTVTQNSQVSTNDNNSYWYITSLEEVVFNEGIQEIGANSFMGCSSLTTIHFPSTLTYLGSSSFSGCNAINKIYSDVVTPFSFTDDVFTDDVYHYADVVVPDGSKPAYKETAGWSNFQCFQTDTPVVTNPEPYAVLSEGNSILTFYYDEKKAERNGMDVGPFYLSTLNNEGLWEAGGRAWNDYYNIITTVVFDPSFANCTTITSTNSWFCSMINMTSVSGLENLNTTNVTDMSHMFRDCRNLVNLDVSGFKTDNVTNMWYMFCNCSALQSLDVSGFNTENVTNIGGMFSLCSSLVSIDVSGFKTDKVTKMSQMFESCSSLTSLDVSGFNTANVTDMDDMFLNCDNLKSLDLGNFNTSQVEYMSRMFYGCSALEYLNVSSFNTENVKSIFAMFMHCNKLTNLDVSGFSLSKITNMECMFSNTSKLENLDLSGFNTDKVTNMNSMFSGCSNLATIYVGDGWTTAAVTNGTSMFWNCTALVGGAGTHFDPDHIDATYARIDGGPNSSTPGYFTDKNAPVVTDPEPYAVLSDNNTVLKFYYDEKKAERNGMDVGPFGIESDRGWNDYCENITTAIFDGSFANCTSLTSTRLWFTGCQNLTAIQDLSNLKTDNVTDMRYMFKSCSSLTSLDVSGFKTDNVTNMGDMFFGCSKLTTLDLSNFNTSQVKYMYYMFSFCSELTSLDVSNFNTENVESMVMMFEDCSSLTSLNVSSFKTENVTKMGNMFNGCSGLTSLDVSNFNTSNVTDMSQMFSGCSSLTSLDVSNFNTSNVTSMNGMFSSCAGLTSLDVSNFNTSIVMNMYAMFSGCSGLKTVYVGDGWTTASVTEGAQMFAGCTNLVGGKGTHYDPDHVDFTYARIDGGPNSQTPGYFTDKDAPVVSGDFGNRMLLLWRQVGGKEYRLYKALDKNQYKTNDDGWKMYLTQLTLDIVDGNDVTTVVVDEGTIYTDDNRYNDMMIPSMMIDKERNMMYVFSNSKPDNGNYTMNGYAYLSPLDQPAFNKEMVFENSNWGWFSIFTGTTSDGQPVLSHFSYAGYYDMVSTRIQEGYWTSESLDNIMPNDMNARWAKTNKVTVIGDTSDDEVTIDGLVYTLRSNNQAAISWVNEKNQLEQLELPSQINHGGTVRTVTAIAPFAFYWCNNLHELNIPSSVSQIEELALRKCSALEKLRVDNVTPPYLKNDEEVTPFDEATCENAILYVPYGAKAAYQETNGWKDFKNIEEFGDPVALDAEPYAVLSDNNTVLTFYYDDQKEARNGMSVGPFPVSTSVRWDGHQADITKVVFDPSFGAYAELTSTTNWFRDCKALTTITGIEYLHTDNVTNMDYMFYNCSSLESLDVSHFKTDNVTNMFSLFYNCSRLSKIDVGGFNTSKVTHMGNLFYGCSNIESIDVSHFDTSASTSTSYMFAGCSKLTDIDISSFNTANVTDFRRMFYNCTSLASIQAGNAEIPAEEYANIGNPNLLVYVNEARLAPEGVQNIVVNGVAKEIVLTDNPDGKIVNNNWYCPEPFRAEKISYTRDFRQQTQIGISRGWESLALPFAVQTITHQDKGAIAPFGSDASGLHFWLRRLGHEGLISVQMIEPNTPYIISMPNSEDYASRFNLNGRVTFAAEDAYVERTEQMEDESADYMMVPTFQRMPVSEYVYALNVGEERNGRPEGSIFERNYREVRPFEAYTLHRGDQPAPLFFELSDQEGTTDILEVRSQTEDGNGEWYDLQGRKLGSTLNVQRSTLKKGVYIRNGRKIVFK